MRLTEILRLVWLNLSQNKGKVLLTSIGIVAGSATIMLVLAIGKGGQMEVAQQFKNLSVGAIDITYEGRTVSGDDTVGMGGPGGGMLSGMGGGNGRMAGRAAGGPGGAPPGFGTSSGKREEAVSLSEADLEEILAYVPELEDGTISFSVTADVEGGNLEESTAYTIAGVKENYALGGNLNLEIGDFITEEEEENKEKVCILGAKVAREIFGSSYNAYNNTVYIDSRPYVVAGVAEDMGAVASGISPDEAIFIPYATGIKYLTGNQANPTITVLAEDVERVDAVTGYLEEVLAERWPDTKFTLSDAGTKMEAASGTNQTLQLLLAAMAVIVFLIGGIGIMNVLFVSVKERTNEIGILKAIGCRRRDILTEFLLEAVFISLTGAVMGVGLGFAITPLIERFSVRVELSLSGAVCSLGFGVLTGSLFGFYPALRASALLPIRALNHE